MFEVKSMYNMLDQQLVIHFNGASQIPSPPSEMPASLCTIPKPSFGQPPSSPMSANREVRDTWIFLLSWSLLPYTQLSHFFLYPLGPHPPLALVFLVSHMPLTAWGRVCLIRVQELRISPVSH